MSTSSEKYTTVERRAEVVAYTLDGERIGSFDKTAGASRGTIRGRVVARTFTAWLDALDWHFLEPGMQTDSTLA